MATTNKKTNTPAPGGKKTTDSKGQNKTTTPTARKQNDQDARSTRMNDK